MSDPVAGFIERLGLVAEEQGFPRIGGRMIAFLLLNDRAYSLDELAVELQVSKASVSTNARHLEQAGILTRTSSPGDRRDYYQISGSHWERMFEVARRRMQRIHDVLDEGLATLPEELEAGRRRVRDMKLFYGFLLKDLDTKIERWRRYRAESEGADREGAGVDEILEEA